MKKGSTVRVKGNMIFKGQKLTLGMDLGDHWSCYCGRPAIICRASFWTHDLGC
jgi:hypothetical protein